MIGCLCTKQLSNMEHTPMLIFPLLLLLLILMMLLLLVVGLIFT